MPPVDDMLYMIFTAGFAFGIGIQAAKLFVENWEDVFAFWVILPVKILLACTKKIFSFINLNMEKAMKTYLILTVIGAVVGALFGGLAGWIIHMIWPDVIVSTFAGGFDLFWLFTLVGVVAGVIGIWTWNKWSNWFATSYVETWHSGAIVFAVCVIFGGAIGAFTGWSVLGLGLGALFGVIVVGMSYGIRRLPLNVQ